MAGLEIIVPGNFGATGWASGQALVRQQFVGDADRAFVLDARYATGLWQDREGTVPVTAFGQPVRRIADRSGQGRDAVLAAAATGVPTWEGAGSQAWVSIPVGAPFQIDNPLRFTDWTVVGAVRLTGISSGTSYPILSQFGPASNSYMALQISRVSSRLGVNLNNAGGHELLGDNMDMNKDYVFSVTKDADMVAGVSTCSLNGAAPVSFSGAFSTPNSDSTTIQHLTDLFSSAGNGVSVAGRLYYMAFTRRLTDPAPLAAIAAQRAGVTLP